MQTTHPTPPTTLSSYAEFNTSFTRGGYEHPSQSLLSDGHGSCCIQGEKEQEAARKASKHGQEEGAPSETHLCPVGVQSSRCFSSGVSPSHFPVSHHPSRKGRACNYPFSTWVPDSRFISEPRLHLTSAAPGPALRGESPCLPTSQSLCGYTLSFLFDL